MLNSLFWLEDAVHVAGNGWDLIVLACQNKTQELTSTYAFPARSVIELDRKTRAGIFFTVDDDVAACTTRRDTTNYAAQRTTRHSESSRMRQTRPFVSVGGRLYCTPIPTKAAIQRSSARSRRRTPSWETLTPAWPTTARAARRQSPAGKISTGRRRAGTGPPPPAAAGASTSARTSTSVT